MGETVKEKQLTYSVWCIVTEHEVLEGNTLSPPLRQITEDPIDISNHGSPEGAYKFINVMKKSFIDALKRAEIEEEYKKETH